MEGWIKLHRQLLDHPIWVQSTPEQKTILITILLMANHEEKQWYWQGKKFQAKPGQFVTSAKSIEKQCGEGISRQNIRTALDKFEKHEFLTKESTKTGMLITIVNWTLYQFKNEELTKELTINQPRTNQEVTTNKNDKNDKNNIYTPKKPRNKKQVVNKIQYAEFVLMTEEEYKKLIAEYGEVLTKKLIEELDNYKGAKGATYKSDYRAILKWVIAAVMEKEKKNSNNATQVVTGEFNFDGI